MPHSKWIANRISNLLAVLEPRMTIRLENRSISHQDPEAYDQVIFLSLLDEVF